MFQKKVINDYIKFTAVVSILVFAGSCLTACKSGSSINQKSLALNMQSKSGSKVDGVVQVVEKTPGLVTFNIKLEGFEPNSVHGFHIHEKGDCTSKDAKSAGGHYNPENHKHGGPKSMNSHAGDLGNLTADKNGQVKTSFSQPGLSLSKKSKVENIHSIRGRALVIHKDKDSFSKQPSGDSGKRIACGVIPKS